MKGYKFYYLGSIFPLIMMISLIFCIYTLYATVRIMYFNYKNNNNNNNIYIYIYLNLDIHDSVNNREIWRVDYVK
jgi:hypothetical protein